MQNWIFDKVFNVHNYFLTRKIIKNLEKFKILFINLDWIKEFYTFLDNWEVKLNKLKIQSLDYKTKKKILEKLI